MSVAFTVSHLDHSGNVLLTLAPVKDSLKWSHRMANVNGPGELTCEFALRDPAMYSDAFAPYATDYRLNMVVNGVTLATPVQSGICTGAQMQSERGTLLFTGKDWLHWLEQPFPFNDVVVGGTRGYALTVSQWLTVLDAAHYWNASTGTNIDFVKFSATQQMVVQDLINSLIASSYDAMAPALTMTFAGAHWANPVNYQIQWGDSTTVLDHLSVLSRMYDPLGFDFWVEANKGILLNNPRNTNPLSYVPIATLTDGSTIISIPSWENDGPAATETVVIGSGTGNGRPWFRDTYAPSVAQYRRWKRIVNITNPSTSIASRADVVAGLAGATGYHDRFPQKTIQIRVKPEAIDPIGTTNFFYTNVGRVINIDSSGYFSNYHRINASFYITAEDFSFDAAGNAVCDLTTEQLYNT